MVSIWYSRNIQWVYATERPMHWDLNRMAYIVETTYSNAFSVTNCIVWCVDFFNGDFLCELNCQIGFRSGNGLEPNIAESDVELYIFFFILEMSKLVV